MTNSNKILFMVTDIDGVKHALGLYPKECTVDGPLTTDLFFFLFLTSDLTLATLERLFSK